jgi:hypothetical protein
MSSRKTKRDGARKRCQRPRARLAGGRRPRDLMARHAPVHRRDHTVSQIVRIPALDATPRESLQSDEEDESRSCARRNASRDSIQVRSALGRRDRCAPSSGAALCEPGAPCNGGSQGRASIHRTRLSAFSARPRFECGSGHGSGRARSIPPPGSPAILLSIPCPCGPAREPLTRQPPPTRTKVRLYRRSVLGRARRRAAADDVRPGGGFCDGRGSACCERS